MQLDIPVNRIQMMCKVLSPKSLVLVCGRATGKSWILGQRTDEAIRRMPRCVIGMPVKTFGMGYTGTFQTMLSALEKFGYIRDGNYVVNRRAPDGWLDPYNKVEKNENTISTANGCKLVMFSQTETGTMRGANVDKIIADEVLTLSEEKLMKEAFPTNRGNLEHFGKGAHHACHLHHGFDLTTSMPYTKEARWVLKYADYYRDLHNCDILQIWNRVVNLQLQLLETTTPAQFAECWNEIERIRQLMPPKISPDGVLFYLANAFDNIRNVGLKYIKDMQLTLTKLEFFVEVLNLFIDRVEDCFYNIDPQKQVYYTGLDTEKMLESGIILFGKQEVKRKTASSVYDRDCNPDLPLEVAPDWGSQISLFVVCQTFNKEQTVMTDNPLYVPEPKFAGDYLYQINEFFAKPDRGAESIIDQICARLVAYYAAHRNKTIIFYRDRYGDHRSPNVLNAKSYNDQAIDYFRRAGWKVITKVHKGMEPPQSDKYLLWTDILSEKASCPVRYRINGQRCGYTLISMNNARMIYGDDRFKKDKSSERPSSGVLPEEATHFSDAIDKMVWTKYGDTAGRKCHGFIRTNMG